MFRELRRQDRKISQDEAINILKKSPYGILSTVGEDGYAYGVPLSYVYLNNNLYFHCAKEGHKLENIKFNDKVSFCVVGNVENIPEKFTVKYESVIVFGRACEVHGEEKHTALMELIKKYSEQFIEKGKEYIEQSDDTVKIIKISIEAISGKANR